jgi:D-3-phosphoglycerate dehydrogenase
VSADTATGPDRLQVLIRESISDAGIQLLREHFAVTIDAASPLGDIIGAYDAIVIRSATKLTAQALAPATRLKVIGRAGVGVDNVDVEAASRQGIVVANAPESTVVSAAEHTIGLLLALARNIPQAHSALKAGRWERARWGGLELDGKTLAILGFGRIGRQVARRAVGLGMRVIAYDPFVGPERFKDLGVERVETLDALLKQADFVTLHSPATAETRGLVDAAFLAKLRPEAFLINAARGSLVDETALADAIRSGRLRGAALDVYSAEPYAGELLELDQVIVTPHLAASTDEAQDRAGVIIAEQVVAALSGQVVTNAVNLAIVDQADRDVLGPFLPLAAQLARLAVGLSTSFPSRLTVAVYGPLSTYDTRPLTAAALEGIFAGRVEQLVNAVNAPLIAAEQGVTVTEERSEVSRGYINTVEVRVAGADGEVAVAGSTVGPEPRLFLSSALGHALDIELAAHMVFVAYADQPGVIGRVGTMFGEAGVNIANMDVSRSREERVMMAFSVDTPVPSELAADLASAGFDDVHVFDASS